jgi:hypothetical protein
MPCRDCQHFLTSDEALKPRGGLAGYGYCKAPPESIDRARFFHESQDPCWLAIPQFKERRHEDL